MKRPLIILLFITSNAFTQSISKTHPFWTLDGTYSPTWLSNIKAKPNTNHIYHYSKFRLPVGLETKYYISKRSTFSIGVNFMYVKYDVKYDWGSQQGINSVLPDHSNYRSLYIDVPLNYHFSFIARDRFSVYTTAGVAATILNGSDDSTTYFDNSVHESVFINKFIPAVQFGVGFRYEWKDNYFAIEPHYRVFMKGFDSVMDQSPQAMYISLSFGSRIDWKCFFKKGAWKPLPDCE